MPNEGRWRAIETPGTLDRAWTPLEIRARQRGDDSFTKPSRTTSPAWLVRHPDQPWTNGDLSCCLHSCPQRYHPWSTSLVAS